MSGSRASGARPFEWPASPPFAASKSTRKRNSRTSTAVIRSGRGSASGYHRRQPATGDGQPHRIRGGGPKEYGRFGYRIASSFFFQAEDGIRDESVTGVQTCALPI